MSDSISPVDHVEEGRVHRVDTVSNDPWKRSCVLTLDGGGIRGYASLWMLKILMDKVKEVEENHANGPHESSFCPRISETKGRGNGDAGASAEPTNMGARRKRTLTTLDKDGSQVRRERGASNSPDAPRPSTKGYLPCHYFDYIGGTSTGGLNAIMLGRLRMSVDDCIEKYPPLAQSVFGRRRPIVKYISTGTKYDEANLERAIKEIVKSRIPPDCLDNERYRRFHTYPSPGDLCKTIVVANETIDDATQPYLFCTYSSGDVDAEFRDHEIWQVARATSAADTFFHPIKLRRPTDNKEAEYSDGGLGNNNPVSVVLDEVLECQGTADIREACSVVLSIGTGQKPTKREKAKQTFAKTAVKYIFTSSQPGRTITKVLGRLKDISTDVEKDHKAMSRLCKSKGFDQYYRFTGGEDVGGLKMDKWKERRKLGKHPTPKFIENKVKAYMSHQEVQADLDKVARELVARRRARVLWDPSDGLWARFTYCTRIACPYGKEEYFGSPRELKEHIQEEHQDKISTIRDIDALVSGFYVAHPEFIGGPF
ncbi:acyl transferase/acyl hydrolase/lysophospholipase [Clohesyomyces aquaticus]|uniref:Acyl transferase/acyl hydrolase/lysophospholipase n=1 Tax=Clohesyomyces aquaticus TaxID=1231657 RepID=A0A1Y2A2I0_9PLEO|nr:acyl transferase/acyl hydrolase/lysophospholipase [Clohesyomyces aquaticus]